MASRWSNTATRPSASASCSEFVMMMLMRLVMMTIAMMLVMITIMTAMIW